MIYLQLGMGFRACIISGRSVDSNRSMIKLCDILSTIMSCRIFVLLPLETTEPRASRFELQVMSYHGMMERRIYVYRSTISIYFILPLYGIAFTLTGSATRYEFQVLYHIGIISGRQQVYVSLNDVIYLLCTKMSCRIFVILHLEMTGSRARRFELQVINHHMMMERGIYM